MVFTLLFPDFYPECRAILPGFRPDSGVVCLADALCNRQPQPGSAAGVGIIQPICSGIYHIGQAGVRPLQSGYSPANLLRLSSIYRYSIPQSAENRLKKCGRFCACRICVTLLPRSLRQPLHGRGGYPWRSFQSCGGLPLRSCPCARSDSTWHGPPAGSGQFYPAVNPAPLHALPGIHLRCSPQRQSKLKAQTHHRPSVKLQNLPCFGKHQIFKMQFSRSHAWGSGALS